MSRAGKILQAADDFRDAETMIEAVLTGMRLWESEERAQSGMKRAEHREEILRYQRIADWYDQAWNARSEALNAMIKGAMM